MTKHIFPLLLVTLVVLAGCTSENQEDTNVVPEKKSIVLTKTDCRVSLDFPAQLKGRQDIDIVPQISAMLEQILVKEGQHVVKGQKMFILAQTEYIAALANANAGVEVAKAQVRTEELEVEAEKILLDKNIISEHQYNVTCNELAQAKAQLAEAEANVVRAKNNLSYTVICAPCNGVVGDINYRQGALVGPTVSKPLTIVSDNSVIYAYSSINEKDYLYHMQYAGGKEKFIEKLPVKCQLILSNGEFYEQEGKIETVSGVVDRQTGAVNMRTAFPNAKGILASGGSATLELSVMENGIVIPRNATYEIQDKTYAYKITKQNNSYVALSTAVEVYRINDKEYLVEKGLSVGDTIAVEGVRKMTNNMEVKPVISALVASNDSVKAVSDSVKVLD